MRRRRILKKFMAIVLAAAVMTGCIPGMIVSAGGLGGGIGRVLTPEPQIVSAEKNDNAHEISLYFDRNFGKRENLVNDWGLSDIGVNQAADISRALGWENIKKINNFYYAEKSKTIVEKTPGFAYVCGEGSDVSLYGCKIGDSIDKLKSSMFINGWMDSMDGGEAFTPVISFTLNGGVQKNLTIYSFYGKMVDFNDKTVNIYAEVGASEDGSIVYWGVTNDGMASQSYAMPCYFLNNRVNW